MDIIVILVVLILIFFIYTKMKKNEREPMTDHLELPVKMRRKNINIHVQKLHLNKYFIETKFHTDYRDVISAINEIVPDQKQMLGKQIFNEYNYPITKETAITTESQNVAKEFVGYLNNVIDDKVTEFRTNNTGWDEPLLDCPEESGWEKSQKMLGLPSSIYPNPVGKSFINFVQVMSAEKQMMDKEIRFILKIAVQKIKSPDQLVLTISLAQPTNNESETAVRIENIDIMGFLTDYGETEVMGDGGDFYDFAQLDKNTMIDNNTLMETLIDKNLQKDVEMEKKIAKFDQSYQRFLRDLPNIEDYESYRVTKK